MRVATVLAVSLIGSSVAADPLPDGTPAGNTPMGSAGFQFVQFTQIGIGTYKDGAAAGGNDVSLLGTGLVAGRVSGSPSITCPYVGATWDIEGGGVFSTALSPGNVTPKITFGTGSVSKTISNLLVSATDANWGGKVRLRCDAIGTSGTIRAVMGTVFYETGQIYFGTSPLNNGGAAITLDNTGTMAVDIKVLMATQSASNKFRLDGLTITRVF